MCGQWSKWSNSGGLDLADALFHDAIMLRRCAFRIRAGICSCGTMPRDRMCPGPARGVCCACGYRTGRGPRWSRARGGAESATPRHDAPPRPVGQCPVTPAGPVQPYLRFTVNKSRCGDFCFVPPDLNFYAGVLGRGWKETFDRSEPPTLLVTVGVNTHCPR